VTPAAPVPADQGKNPPVEKNTAEKNPAVDAAHRALLDDRLARFAAIDADQVARAANRNSQDPAKLVDWAANWFNQQQPKVTDAIEPIFAAIFAVTNRSGHEGAAQAFAKSYCDAARDLAILAPGDPAFAGLRDSMLDQIFPDRSQESLE
jgi:hypothetical protein